MGERAKQKEAGQQEIVRATIGERRRVDIFASWARRALHSAPLRNAANAHRWAAFTALIMKGEKHGR